MAFKINFTKIFLFIGYCNFLIAQDNPLITDRPDVTESAQIISLNSFQFETGFIIQNNSVEINGRDFNFKSYSIMKTLLRYGLVHLFELRIAAEYFYQDFNLNNIKGIDGLIIGTKAQLIKNKNSLPEAALLIHFKLPVGNENLRPEKVEPEIIAAVSKILNDQFSLGINFGGNYNSSNQTLNYLYSISLALSLTEKLGGFVEYYSELSSESLPLNNFDGGFTYLILPDIQLDISTGTSIQNTSNWFVSTGISLRTKF